MQDLEYRLGAVAHPVNVRDRILLARGKSMPLSALLTSAALGLLADIAHLLLAAIVATAQPLCAWPHCPVKAEGSVAANTSCRHDPHQLRDLPAENGCG
jgi:hypothetical protein